MTNDPGDTSNDSNTGPERGPRDWQHIYKTRIRTSTAVLVVLFVACSILYGFTSQRYGVVAEPTVKPRTTTSTPTYEEPSTTMSSSTSSSSSSPSTGTGSGTGTDNQAPGEEGSASRESATETVPGLPGVPLPPQFQQSTVPTTSVPSR